MAIARRTAWVLTGVLAIPGLLVGMVTGYAFLIAPSAFVSGAVVGRSTAGVRFSLGILAAMVIGFAFALGAAWGSEYWRFFAGYGPSALLAVVVMFKAGTEARLRL